MTPLNSILNLTSILIQKYEEEEESEKNEDLGLLVCVNNSAKVMKMMNQTFLEC